MPAKTRAIDLLVNSFDLNQRRKFVVKGADGQPVLDLYFKPITRSDRQRATTLANSEEALEISTQMLCQMAELEDGSKAFEPGDAPKLKRQLPESVLNELELFLFGLGDDANLQEAKND